MNRYFYYPVIVCMLTNTILFIPSILIKNRFHGAIPAMVLSVILGTLLAHLFTRGIMRFPGKGVPEVLAMYAPKWARVSLLLFLSCMWFTAGGMVLVCYCRILQRFVNPDFSIFILIGFVGLVCAWSASNDSKTVLYINEIVIILNLPFIGFILFKALASQNMDWDAVRVMTHYSFGIPSWESLASASHIFTGYVNWTIFNRNFQVDAKRQFLWLIPLVGTTVLITTFFIPIGFHGTYGVDQLNYIWESTADSMRVEFGFIERVLFIFLLLYLSIAMIYIMTTWHLGSELMKSVVPRKMNPLLVNHARWSSWIIICFFAVITEISTWLFDEKKYMVLSSAWFQLRLISEVVLVVVIYWIGKKKGKT
ncbi:hypothetical protein [Paenibacillus sp. N3.4]|uniref:hypothetical protein n=1 Tax=Paenibacillus sp. N3.4 TaxID=2603222 RepID=UPI0011C755DB|nr:hypothetical protein [Paenibacillus sp. N3.4]TXK81362.1 hypothetical protein FU659_16465 [Paenibacillus sp. N3.4]